MLTIQNYLRPATLEEAYALNQTRGSRLLGGMLWLRQSDLTITNAIDLSGLGLDTVEEGPEAFSIGAMTTLRTLERHPGLNAFTGGAVNRAVRDIVGVQFRNMATVGGSLFGRFGFSDVLTVFLALDCQVELYKGGLVPLEDFARTAPDRDILTRLLVNKRPGPVSYQAVRNSRTDFPVLTCAAACLEGQYRLAVGARPQRAMVLRDEEGILSGGLDSGSICAFADYAAAKVPTAGNLRGSAQYRTHLVRVLTKRALAELGGIDSGT